MHPKLLVNEIWIGKVQTMETFVETGIYNSSPELSEYEI